LPGLVFIVVDVPVSAFAFCIECGRCYPCSAAGHYALCFLLSAFPLLSQGHSCPRLGQHYQPVESATTRVGTTTRTTTMHINDERQKFFT